MNKKLKDKMITAMVFLAEDTNGMVIHLNGFDNSKHADSFVKTLMKNRNKHKLWEVKILSS